MSACSSLIVPLGVAAAPTRSGRSTRVREWDDCADVVFAALWRGALRRSNVEGAAGAEDSEFDISDCGFERKPVPAEDAFAARGWLALPVMRYMSEVRKYSLR